MRTFFRASHQTQTWPYTLFALEALMHVTARATPIPNRPIQPKPLVALLRHSTVSSLHRSSLLGHANA